MGKVEDLPAWSHTPNSTAREKQGTCWPDLPGEVTRVRRYNLCTDVWHQDQQNPGLALDVQITLRRMDSSLELKCNLANELRNAERGDRAPQDQCDHGPFTRFLYFTDRETEALGREMLA